MEGPPMRPGFPPRFEGPPGPEFFNRMPFDEHPRHRRHDDRRRFSREDPLPPESGAPVPPTEKPDRKSRWSSGSPVPKQENNEMPENVEMISEEKSEVKNDNFEINPPGDNTPIKDEFESVKPKEEAPVEAVVEAPVVYEESKPVENEPEVKPTEETA